MKYVLFAKPACPFCVRAETLLKERSLVCHVVNFDEDQEEVLQSMKVAWDWETVPMVFHVGDKGDIKFIGGCDDLEQHLSV